MHILGERVFFLGSFDENQFGFGRRHFLELCIHLYVYIINVFKKSNELIMVTMILKKFICFALARAKEKAPCIIFIDEIDSVGSKRVADAMHPHANQTVNQVCSTVSHDV